MKVVKINGGPCFTFQDVSWYNSPDQKYCKDSTLQCVMDIHTYPTRVGALHLNQRNCCCMEQLILGQEAWREEFSGIQMEKSPNITRSSEVD